ncbi:Aminomethyltransferase (glycine cleavage system T protein) [[Actinomadura] parvosata subsp. kistnae]|uniref:Aminomethyltransferase n=1 Tax=[Actinomadura] parvosata subsp. kistnae TaxID=1909395 RepID=A0A1V0A7I9_9ACTN|nr:glycine cleavage system aminomethyltransferase GcvT [Nonomuraea sp. ATCC 55076]AQZ66139.1 glycine cleavage system protein T [Nonomuraea sp. ATCC 55076]SPL97643.1 Aminomethyltransferase (glycine cleavage system T protein) [Actinomadura parvosata subsp. kistnae]
MSRPTPLRDVHESLGATLTDFAGWLMPLRYGSESAEHRAVREAAGLFDLSHMGEIFLTGPQAGEALDYALVGHLSALAPGRARYTMIVNERGGVLDDLIVYRLGDEEFMVVANASNSEKVAQELRERAKPYETVVTDRSAEYALIAVQGPRSQEILATLTDADLAGLKYYAGLPGQVDGRQALIARTGYTGEDGFELFVANEDAVPLWHALTAAGEPYGLKPAGLSSRDTLRLEAGMPLYGNELSAQLTPFDAGLGRVVKFDKPGDFVGRSALEAVKDDQPRRRLVGLVARTRRVPRHGYPVTKDGAVVGEVTSGAPSQTLGKPIAMAYVDTGADSGLAVDIRGSHEPMDLVELPFYRRNK